MEFLRESEQFNKLIECDDFIFTKDVKLFLESEGLLEADDAIIQLRRKLHTAGPREKSIIQKALDQLMRKRTITKKRAPTVDLAGRYVVHTDWGENEFGHSVDPDTWFQGFENSLKNMEEPEGDGMTFIYLTTSDRLLFSTNKMAHIHMIQAAIDEGEVTLDDIPQQYISKKDSPEDNIERVLYDSNINWKIGINGRTGRGTVHHGGNPMNDMEEEFEEEPCGSIWNTKAPKNILVKCFDKVNNENDMGEMIRHWFVPKKIKE